MSNTQNAINFINYYYEQEQQNIGHTLTIYHHLRRELREALKKDSSNDAKLLSWFESKRQEILDELVSWLEKPVDDSHNQMASARFDELVSKLKNLDLPQWAISELSEKYKDKENWRYELFFDMFEFSKSGSAALSFAEDFKFISWQDDVRARLNTNFNIDDLYSNVGAPDSWPFLDVKDISFKDPYLTFGPGPWALYK